MMFDEQDLDLLTADDAEFILDRARNILADERYPARLKIWMLAKHIELAMERVHLEQTYAE